MTGIISGHFLEASQGPIFVVLRQPEGCPKGCVLVVPPFAEEMNKSRRMITELSLALSSRGMATLVPDLFGTGDSGGDFSDADWDTWLGDLAVASQWSVGQGHPVTGVLAIRLGASLAVQAAEQGKIPAVQRTVFWQPVLDGRLHLTQFLRLRVAAKLMEDKSESVAELRECLEGGERLEVAGYTLTGKMAAGIDAVRAPARLPGAIGAVSWLEVSRDANPVLAPASVRQIEHLQSSGSSIEPEAFADGSFWSATEIVVASTVVERTVQIFTSATE